MRSPPRLENIGPDMTSNLDALHAPISSPSSKQSSDGSFDPSGRLDSVHDHQALPTRSKRSTFQVDEGNEERSDHVDPKRSKLEVFELGNDSDAEDAECQTSAFETETLVSDLEFNYYK